MSNSPAEQCSVILRVTRGPSKGQELVFTDHQTFVVGRADEAHLRLSTKREFSRFHSRLEINPPQVTIVDLGSTNGTKVNGRRVETARLETGDEVTLGDTRFNVTVMQPVEESPPTEAYITSPFTPQNTGNESPSQNLPKLPGYSIESHLGQGSMGAVYSARRNATGEKVAVKIVRPMMAADPQALVRFRRESAIVLRLQHKRIVRSIDFGETQDYLPFLVMEYIEQVDLPALLRETSVRNRCRIAAGLMVRVLEGLQYAHDMEIVHRDIKPANLLIYRAGRKLQVKVADFGLAKNFVDAGFSNCSASNEICGTLAYMPPEQIINCRYAKPGCDIYAAGVCLYNMISGRLPYESPTAAEQISMILNGAPVPLAERVPEAPEGLFQIVAKAIAGESDARYASAEEMRKELLPFTRRFWILE